MNRACFLGTLVLAALAPALLCGSDAEPGTPKSGVKCEAFDKDPGWEGYNNRLVPRVIPVIRQDYGYSGETRFASDEKGEIGGKVVRCSTPTYYAAKFAGKTLNDK